MVGQSYAIATVPMGTLVTLPRELINGATDTVSPVSYTRTASLPKEQVSQCESSSALPGACCCIDATRRHASQGRRLILFPGMAVDATVDQTLNELLSPIERCLVLAPNDHAKEAVKTQLPNGFSVLGPEDIESDLSSFIQKDKAILLLANRYDGNGSTYRLSQYRQ